MANGWDLREAIWGLNCEGGKCYVVWAGEWNNETSSGGGRELGYLLECDPTCLGVEGEGDLWLDQ